MLVLAARPYQVFSYAHYLLTPNKTELQEILHSEIVLEQFMSLEYFYLRRTCAIVWLLWLARIGFGWFWSFSLERLNSL